MVDEMDKKIKLRDSLTDNMPGQRKSIQEKIEEDDDEENFYEYIE